MRSLRIRAFVEHCKKNLKNGESEYFNYDFHLKFRVVKDNKGVVYIQFIDKDYYYEELFYIDAKKYLQQKNSDIRKLIEGAINE